MQPFQCVAGAILPIDRENVDTDAIMPQRWLVTTERTGLGKGFFGSWRYDENLDPRADCVLNHPGYQDARVLVAGSNYGCGSSREHAVWAHLDYGIRVVIAPSYGPIFYENALKNGLLAVVLPEETVATLMHQAAAQPGAACSVDLRTLEITGPDGAIHAFELDPGRRAKLLEGRDDIALTLEMEDRIAAFQERDRTHRPWIS